MNKRIEELAEQAGNKRINDYYTNGTVTAFTDIQLQKFAELIIGECADIAAKNQAEDMNWNIAEIIKEHFGVE